MPPPPPRSTLFPYTTLFRSMSLIKSEKADIEVFPLVNNFDPVSQKWLPSVGNFLNNPAGRLIDRKSTRLNSSHVEISYAVFCLKKKTTDPCISNPDSHERFS